MTEHERAAIMQYLDDTFSSDPGQSEALLKALIIEQFALTEDEASEVYKEWWAKP